MIFFNNEKEIKSIFMVNQVGGLRSGENTGILIVIRSWQGFGREDKSRALIFTRDSHSLNLKEDSDVLVPKCEKLIAFLSL